MNAVSDDCRLPDVAAMAAPAAGRGLDWVGMQGIDLPIAQEQPPSGRLITPARVDVAVDLADPGARGIHMSRLYLALERSLASQAPTPTLLRSLLRALRDSQARLSTRARVRIAYRHLARRDALVSDEAGWQAYPAVIEAQLADDDFTLQLGCDVQYSSTCPASLALSRHANQQRFDEDFVDATPSRGAVREWLGSVRGTAATPHAQRSTARVRVRLAPDARLWIAGLIDLVEHALATPVQTAVKRVDEQAFAVLNAANPMFCEDAARRIGAALDGDPGIAGWHVHVAHHESLHPHDAIAEASRAFPAGGEHF